MALFLNTVSGSSKPNFSGTWVMDKDRSFSNPAGLEQTMTIKHSGDAVELEAKLTTPQGERVVSENWMIDGQERQFTPGGAAPGSSGKRKAYWLPGNRGVVVSEETVTDSPKGPVTHQATRKYMLSPDGNTLTVDYYIDGPRGSGEAKRIFNRKP